MSYMSFSFGTEEIITLLRIYSYRSRVTHVVIGLADNYTRNAHLRPGRGESETGLASVSHHN